MPDLCEEYDSKFHCWIKIMEEKCIERTEIPCSGKFGSGKMTALKTEMITA